MGEEVPDTQPLWEDTMEDWQMLPLASFQDPLFDQVTLAELESSGDEGDAANTNKDKNKDNIDQDKIDQGKNDQGKDNINQGKIGKDTIDQVKNKDNIDKSKIDQDKIDLDKNGKDNIEQDKIEHSKKARLSCMIRSE